MPQWNESKVFGDVDPAGTVLRIDAYDDERIKDHHLGRAEFSVATLLRKGTMEMELEDKATSTKNYVTFSCVQLSAEKGGTSKVDNVPRSVDEGEKAPPPQLGESWVHASAETKKEHAAPSGGPGLSLTSVAEPRATPSQELHSDHFEEPLSPAAGAVPRTGAPLSIRVTALCGRGFPTKKHRIGKDDIPDVYCKVRLRPSTGAEATGKWKTSVIKNDTAPEWNETKEYVDVDPSEAVLRVDAYDDGTIRDVHCGHAEFPVGLLLEKGAWEMELTGDKGPTGMYVTFRCEPV